MTFLNFFMIFGALAAGIPVAIHLFFRSRYRTVPWAAMQFLLTSVEQTSRRLKFQELLLLLLRMLVLILLAFAFMRPASSSTRGAGRGDAVDAVFLFDLSFSMGAKDQDGKTRLKLAQEEALKIVNELPPHSTVQIVTCAGADRAVLGPRSPADLNQARKLIEDLDLVHLNTDLQQGVSLAKDVVQRGQASNKELYLFSDMQKMGFDQQTGDLKQTLLDIKEKAVVHFVRCGTRNAKNVAVVDIKPQSGVPRPGERVGFAVLVRNSSKEPMTKLRVTLGVEGEKNPETNEIAKIPPGETYAVTLHAKLEKPGPHVLTATVSNDELDADNRFDQIVLVRDQVNILVVDGNYNEREPEKASSYFLMHSLLPVKDSDRATYKYNPRVISARQAAPVLLKGQDICVLVNCSLQPRAGLRADTLPADFVEALESFVRKDGKGLVVFSGDNVQPEPYNKLLFAKHGLLPMPLKAIVKTPAKEPHFINRDTFGQGPATYWKFKDDKYYEIFDAVPIWQHVELDPTRKAGRKEEGADRGEKDESASKKSEDPVQVIVKMSNGQPLVVNKKVDAGEVIFIGTAAQQDGQDPMTGVPNWTIFHRLPAYVYFLDATIAHLMHRKTQTYNLVAGQKLEWYPTDKFDHIYSLVHPDRTIERLNPPETIDKRLTVTKGEFTKAGVYRMISQPRGIEGSDTVDLAAALKTGTPIAVVPDLTESADLTALSAQEIDGQLGFAPIHIVAGSGESVSTGAERLNREWTVWVLLAVLILVLVEVAFAWWCGRAW